jgi:hypothetical protein
MAASHGGIAVPYFISLRARRTVRRVAVATCFAFLAIVGSALADCPAQPVSTPFQQWGDTNSYFLVPGGSLEGTLDDIGWNLSNASLTQGNEQFNVNDPGDSQSLTINGGGSATSPYFCVDNSMASMRFFAQQTNPGSDLQIQAVIQTWHGPVVKSIGDIADGSMSADGSTPPAWAPTDPIDGGASQLPAGRTLMVALRFQVPSTDGTWQIDDIYVDPYRSG